MPAPRLKVPTGDNMPRLPRRRIVGVRSEIKMFSGLMFLCSNLTMEILQAFDNLDSQSKTEVGSPLIDI